MVSTVLELLEPSLVVNRYTVVPDESLVRVRGVRVHADLKNASGIHIDIYDAEQGFLRETSDDLREQMNERCLNYCRSVNFVN